MPYQEHQEPPKIIPRAYTIQEMEDMREAIKSIMIGESWYGGEGSYYADSKRDKVEIEERLRTHMLCNQDPQPLIDEGQRLYHLRWAKYKEAEARREELRQKRIADQKARFDRECQLEIERQMRSFEESQREVTIIPAPDGPDPTVWIVSAAGVALFITVLLLMP